MDTSKEYIEMCRCAEEIQTSVLGPSSFAVISGEFHKSQVVVIGELSYFSDDYKWDVEVWLPRQDQLQGMLLNEPGHDEPYRLFNKLYAFGEQRGVEKSPEELTLKYVMYTLYGKHWDGKEWVK